MSRHALFFFLVFHLSSVFSTPLGKDKVPEPLKPWTDWVLQAETTYPCPFIYNNFRAKQCSWPGLLTLNLYATGADFNSHWQVYNDSWITLPGDKNHWPQNVTVNNKAAIVMDQQDRPHIKLTAGSYKITGYFLWDKIPENLAIPVNTGIVNLTINNQEIAYPIIKKNSIWLKQSDRGNINADNVDNKLELQVYRKVDDTVPLLLTTVIELNVSGEQREITLPHALLADFIPTLLKSPLPARIEPNGDLLVQVRPGRWLIELSARHPQPLSQLKLDINDSQWPKNEIWSFNAMPFLRVVEISGLNSIDPSQTNIPEQWKKMPAYLLKQGEMMSFDLVRRGNPEPEPNQLKLYRRIWLDFNGTGYTVADHISGKMTNGWRLDALPETKVGQVRLNGLSQLVTQSVETAKTGVEVRQGNIQLHADSRIEGDISNISAVGWEQNIYNLAVVLNIPPGWQLFAVSGVDNDPKSWVSKWTLLDLFLVLIASLAISRLWNLYWGVFALLSLGLCWHEAQAPHYIWLNIIAVVALLRVLPESRFKVALSWYKNISGVFLLIITIPFMVSQVRTGLYPQLENQLASQVQRGWTLEDIVSEKNEEFLAVKPELSSAREFYMKGIVELSDNYFDKLVEGPDDVKFERFDPDANIQTGPGLPQWQWSKIYLSWNGSVNSQQQLSLWYISPKMTLFLNFFRVLLVLVLSLLMFGVLNKRLKIPKIAFSWLILIPFLPLTMQDAHADFPDQKILDELKIRLLEAPDCAPVCAQIESMHLSIKSSSLTIKMQVHAQQTVAIPLPAQLEQWMPRQVLVDGRITNALIKRDNVLWLVVKPGVHQVELKGLNTTRGKFSLPLILKPQFVTVKATGWLIEGVHKNGQADRQLLLSRLKSDGKIKTTTKTLESGVLPAFVRVERILKLGLDWQLTTRIIRMANNDSPIVLKIPLLKDESVITEKIRVVDNHVLVNMSASQKNLQWVSTLKKSSQIQFTATITDLWNEVWRADISPMWHLQTSGISVVYHQNKGRWLPEWRPWPGEKVVFNISRPKAIPGATLTIDSSNLILKPGKRSVESDLMIRIRSSKGTQHTITLPENAQLQSVNIDGVNQPIRQQHLQVTLPIKPGLQNVRLQWLTTQEQQPIFVTPIINLGIKSVNHNLTVEYGRNRWVLFVFGPTLGPAVLFWGVLIVIAILSFGLGKTSWTPLKGWHWFLLLVGLSQIPVFFSLWVVIWLFALGYRAKAANSQSRYFNLTQIGLGILTIISLLVLFVAVRQGLLGSPDMQITGHSSSSWSLQWYQDRNLEELPTSTIISIPQIVYRILMLLWSLWLALSLLNWLKWGWQCFALGGIWQNKKENIKTKVNKEPSINN